MPRGHKKQNKNRSNIVTTSIKSLKMVHIQKKNFFFKAHLKAINLFSDDILLKSINEIRETMFTSI